MNDIDTASGESAELDFKASFDAKHDWCELIKDITAMANSGGGRILVGISDDGMPSGADLSQLLNVDLADVVNKIRGFTDVNFSALTIRTANYAGAIIAEISIQAAPTPLVFGKSGNYADANGKQQCAFRQGMLYIRHGPKSEPATSDDLRSMIQQNVDRQRIAMLSNLRQVIEAPANAIVTVAAPVENLSVPVVAVNSDEAATAVRIVDKPSSREAVVLDINSTHPFRQKEVVDAVNQRFAGVIRFTTNDNLAVRRVHKVDTQSKFCYRPRFGSCQYSEGYVDWLIESISLDAEFLPKTRRHHHDLVVANNLSREGKTQ
jgi:hypothetical protein